jgi:hypothetical protein
MGITPFICDSAETETFNIEGEQITKLIALFSSTPFRDTFF